MVGGECGKTRARTDWGPMAVYRLMWLATSKSINSISSPDPRGPRLSLHWGLA